MNEVRTMWPVAKAFSKVLNHVLWCSRTAFPLGSPALSPSWRGRPFTALRGGTCLGTVVLPPQRFFLYWWCNQSALFMFSQRYLLTMAEGYRIKLVSYFSLKWLDDIWKECTSLVQFKICFLEGPDAFFWEENHLIYFAAWRERDHVTTASGPTPSRISAALFAALADYLPWHSDGLSDRVSRSQNQ